MLQVTGGVIGTLVVALGIGLLVLQTTWGSTHMARYLADLANPFEDAAIELESAHGNWVSSVEVRGIRLQHGSDTPDPATVAELDTLRLSYNLPALLQRTVHVQSLDIVGPSLTARQRPDSTWALPRLVEEEEDAIDLNYRLDRIDLTEGRATTDFYAGDQDSTLHVNELRVGMRDVFVADQVTGRLEALTVDSNLPGSDLPLTLDAQADLGEERFTLDHLQLDAPHSHVRGDGTLRLPEHVDDSLDDVQFSFNADPLSFQDLAPLLPALGLNPEEELRVDARATGIDNVVDVQLDASFLESGSLTIDAAATPVLPEPDEESDLGALRYTADASLRGLTAGFLADSELDSTTVLNADLQADLEGNTLNELAGTLEAGIFESHMLDYDLTELRLASAMEEGEATFTLDGDLVNTILAGEGSVRPFDDQPTYGLDLQVSDLDLGAILQDTTQSSDLHFATTIEGRGFDYATAELSTTTQIRSSVVNEKQIDDGTIRLDFADEAFDFDTRVSFPEGRFAFEGDAHYGSDLRYTIRDGRIDAFNVAALAGDTTDSALNGAFHLEGTGTDPSTMDLTATLDLDESYYGPYPLTTARTETALSEGELDVSADATFDEGSVRLAVTGRPFDDRPTIRTTRGTFEDMDIATFAADTTQSSDLSGTFQLQAEAFDDPTAMQASAGIALDSSRVNQKTVDEGSMDLTLQNEALDFDFSLTLPEGHTRFAGRAEPFAEEPTYALRDGAIEGLDLGALVGRPDLTTDLHASFDLDGEGVDWPTMRLNAQAIVDTSMVNHSRVDGGTLALGVADGEGNLTSEFSFADGRAMANASLRNLDDTPSYTAQGEIEDVDWSALAPDDTLASRLSLNFDLEGEGLDPETMTQTGHISSTESNYGDIELEALDLSWTLSEGLLAVDTLALRSNVARAEASGRMAVVDPDAQYDSDFRLSGELDDLDPLRPFLDARILAVGDARFEGRVYGRPGTLRFDASTTFANLLFDEVRIGDGEAYVAGVRGTDEFLSAAEARGTFDYLSIADFALDETRIEASYDGTDVDFDTRATIDRHRNVHLAGTAAPFEEVQTLTLHTLNANFGLDRWELLQEASIIHDDAYRIRNLLLFSGDQQIAADGLIDFDGTQNLLVTLENMRVDPLTDLAGYQGLGGRVNGTLDLTGDADDPRMLGSLQADVTSFDEPAGEVEIDLDYDDLQLDIDALFSHQDGSELDVQGHLPTDLRLDRADEIDIAGKPVDLNASTAAFSVGWIEPFLDSETTSDLTGLLTADVHVGGTLDDPALDGNVSLNGGAVSLPQLNTEYRSITASLDLVDDQVIVREASMRSGSGGRARVAGVIDLSQLTVGAYDLTVTSNDFQIINTREFRARANSSLNVSGTTTEPRVSGDIRIPSANILFSPDALGQEVEAVALTEEDRQMLERRFGVRLADADLEVFDVFEALSMDINLRLERDTWLRSRGNPEMNIQFRGSLDVEKDPFEDMQVFGSIDVLPERSRLTYLGKVFQLDEGNLTFTGPPADPEMNIRAVHSVRSRASQDDEVQIALVVTGSPETPSLELESDPPMEMADILSYIAVGRPASDFAGGGEGVSGEQLATNIAFGQAATIVENLAAAQLGLDVVRITDDPRGTFVTAGRQISPRFFVAVEQPIGSLTNRQAQTDSNVPDITLEYEIQRWLLARTVFRNQSLRLNLMWEYSY